MVKMCFSETSMLPDEHAMQNGIIWSFIQLPYARQRIHMSHIYINQPSSSAINLFPLNLLADIISNYV
jgi:hypothetical protein